MDQRSSNSNLPSSSSKESSSSPVQKEVAASNNNNVSSSRASMKTGGGDNLSTLSPTSDISLITGDSVISPEKYQRLATEYAKLRANFAVLKKGVIEQKAKNEELQETVKARDQAARRAQQETESLVFRNQQLTKRISVLQSDLEQPGPGTTGNQKRAAGFLFAGDGGNKHRSSSNASNTSGVDADLVEEIHHELRTKLEENDRLQELIRSLESSREQELKMLEKRLKEEAETKANHQVETLTGEIRSLNAAVTRTKAEKTSLETKFEECRKRLEETVQSVEALKEENAQLKSRVMVAEKQVIAARQNARLQASKTSSTLPPPTTTSPVASQHVEVASAVPNGIIPRSGSFSGIIRSSGSFSRGVGGGSSGLIRSGSLSINHSGSPALASLIANSSQLSQSTKDLGSGLAVSNNISGLGGQQGSSHPNYKDTAVRQRLITEFATKVAEITCALSTLHSNVSKKISILYALLNNNVAHLYFFDVSAFKEAQSAGALNLKEVAASVGRSEYVQNILRKFNDSLRLYDSHLVILEESIHQYLSAKVRFNQEQQMREAEPTSSAVDAGELTVIEQDLAKHAKDILEKFTDYVNYLNKINPYMSLCVALWCKNISEYDPENADLVSAVGLKPSVQTKLADGERRAQLCSKHEQFASSVTNCIRIIGQIANQVKLLLSKSAQLNPNYLTVFNHLMHRINALEKAFDETKTLYTSKLALEHDLGITVATDLLSVDDAILSSMVFFRKAIIDMRLMMEMHYFFFVSHGGDGKPKSGISALGSSVTGGGNVSVNGIASSPVSTSPLASTISGQLIPEEDDEEEEEEEDDDVDMKEVPHEKTNITPVNMNEDENSSPEKKRKQETKSQSSMTEEATSCLKKELADLHAEKEQWTIESEWRQLKLAEEQRKVAELELRVQGLLTAAQKQTQANSTSGQAGTSQSNSSNAQPLKRASSNSNSLASNKSLDGGSATTVTTTGELQSPTLDCFGTVAYPAITADQPILPLDSLLTPEPVGGEERQQPSLSYRNLQTQMASLVNALQLTDSRASALEGDCLSLRAQYLALAKEKAEVEERLNAHHLTMGRIEEEYQTSVENYEATLRTMSEHLAELNEKLTGQRETIDILQYQQQQQQGGKTSSAASSAASSVVKSFRRSFKKQ